MALPERKTCKIGQWVQVHRIVLEAGHRAQGVPEDTAQVPMQMWVKGFAQYEATVGSQLTIVTAAGRRVTGELVAIHPGYEHGFGQPVPELLEVARELRQRYRNRKGAPDLD